MAKNLLFLFTVLCCLTSFAFAASEYLFVVEDADESIMYNLIDSGFDVRGVFDGYAFLFAPDVQSINSHTTKASSLGRPNALSYVVIQGESSTNEWRQMIRQIRTFQPNFSILFDIQNLIVVGIYEKELLDISHIVKIPREAEYVTFPESSILPTRVEPEILINQKIKNLTFRRSIEQLIALVNEQDLRVFLEHLTGEEGSEFLTRHSSSGDAVLAGEFAMEVFQKNGFNATSDHFRTGYCPNIIAELKGTLYPDEIVVVGAHLDCRNRDLTDSRTRAPGANDDGSGSASILELARAIGTLKVKFARTLRLALWCGEEQGLVGSRAYALRVSNEGQDVVAMYQADMIGYQAYASPQCAFVSLYTNAALTTLTKQIATLYVPEITRVDTTACCSDHQSFYERGYPSVGLVEGGGYTIDPRYHHVEDTANRSGFSFNQMQSIARILLASAADIAEII